MKPAHIQFINTPKFKDIVISVKFLCPLERSSSIARNLLSSMLQDRCEKYNTKDKVTAVLDNLYGAFITSRTLTYGKSQMLEFRCKALNEKFCKTAHLEQQFELVHQFLFHPLLNEESLKEAKDNLMDAVARKLDKPASYANNQALLMMGENEPLEKACFPSLEEISSMTLEKIAETWQNMLNEDFISIQIQGEINEDIMRRYIHRFLPFTGSDSLPEIDYAIHKKELREKAEQRHIDQTSLIMIFETNTKASDADFWKLRCANALFGQLPTSLLFQEVREKRSLCYSIYSSILSYEGCMSISTGISYEKLEETKAVIFQQLKRMQNGEFSDEDFETAKIMLKDSVLSTADDMNATMNFEYQNLILNQQKTLADCLYEIEATTKEDVVRLFSQITHRVTFVLKQEENHE